MRITFGRSVNHGKRLQLFFWTDFREPSLQQREGSRSLSPILDIPLIECLISSEWESEADESCDVTG